MEWNRTNLVLDRGNEIKLQMCVRTVVAENHDTVHEIITHDISFNSPTWPSEHA